MDLSQTADAAPNGAGSTVPGVGAALGAVGGIALDLAPELGRWLFGPDAAPVAAAVQGAVQAATGTADPAAQVAALADPALAARLRVGLAGIAAARAAAADADAEARLASRLADVANARAMALQLAQAGGHMAWGATVASFLVLATFGTVMGLVLLRAMPPGSETVLNVLLGTLAAMATNVVGYWVGSSVGSARKDARLAQRGAE